MKPAAFADAFARHARLLWVVAAAHAPRALAEDIVQEAAMIALGKLRDLQDASGFKPWMARIVRNVAHNAARRGARDARTLPLAAARSAAAAAATIPPAARLDADALGLDDALAGALDHLGDDARVCLLLAVVAGLSYDEISAVTDISAGTVGSHVSRARATLRAQLSPTESRR